MALIWKVSWDYYEELVDKELTEIHPMTLLSTALGRIGNARLNEWPVFSWQHVILIRCRDFDLYIPMTPAGELWLLTSLPTHPMIEVHDDPEGQAYRRFSAEQLVRNTRGPA